MSHEKENSGKIKGETRKKRMEAYSREQKNGALPLPFWGFEEFWLRHTHACKAVCTFFCIRGSLHEIYKRVSLTRKGWEKFKIMVKIMELMLLQVDFEQAYRAQEAALSQTGVNERSQQVRALTQALVDICELTFSVNPRLSMASLQIMKVTTLVDVRWSELAWVSTNSIAYTQSELFPDMSKGFCYR